MPKVTPFLWYQVPLDEAVSFVIDCMLKMRKIDVAELDRAAEEVPA